MNIRIDQLVRSLLQKDSLEHCSLPELQQFAGKNPYLGAAQLLLAKKMQAENWKGSKISGKKHCCTTITQPQ